MDYELNMEIASSMKENKKKFLFFPVNLVAVFNQDTGENNSSINSLNQRLESICVQLKFSRNLIQNFQILFRSKKLIIKNYNLFFAIRKRFNIR